MWRSNVIWLINLGLYGGVSAALLRQAFSVATSVANVAANSVMYGIMYVAPCNRNRNVAKFLSSRSRQRS